MMSLAYFKPADVANIFFSFKSLQDPLSTRKWNFHTAVSNPETVSSAHIAVEFPTNILSLSSVNFHPETRESLSPVGESSCQGPLLPSQHRGVCSRVASVSASPSSSSALHPKGGSPLIHSLLLKLSCRT